MSSVNGIFHSKSKTISARQLILSRFGDIFRLICYMYHFHSKIEIKEKFSCPKSDIFFVGRGATSFTLKPAVTDDLDREIAAMQEIHFTCVEDCKMPEEDYVVLSTFGDRHIAGVSQQVRRSLEADVNLVFACDRGQLVLTDVAVKIFRFQVIAWERRWQWSRTDQCGSVQGI